LAAPTILPVRTIAATERSCFNVVFLMATPLNEIYRQAKIISFSLAIKTRH
jgi:hypothetical protein